MKKAFAKDAKQVRMYGSIPLIIRTDFLREEGSNMRCDDSDMKIMPERVSKVFDSAEGAAVAFAREKANGNMDKARALGLRFAQELICKEGGLTSFGVGAFDDADGYPTKNPVFLCGQPGDCRPVPQFDCSAVGDVIVL